MFTYYLLKTGKYYTCFIFHKIINSHNTQKLYDLKITDLNYNMCQYTISFSIFLKKHVQTTYL